MPRRDWVEKYFSSKSLSVSFNSDDNDVLIIIDKKQNDEKRYGSKWKFIEDGIPKFVESWVENNGNDVKQIESVPYTHYLMAERVYKKLSKV